MSGWTDMFAPGSEVAPATTLDAGRPMTVGTGKIAYMGPPVRITPPSTPPATGGRTLRLWSSFGLSDVHVASIAGALPKVQELVRLDPDAVNEGSGFGFTPLHMAAGHGRADVMTFLISAGATVEAMGDRGYTPVHLAALHGHSQCLKILMEAGGSVECAELEGFYPIHLAARAGHQRAVEVLVAVGVNPMMPGGPTNSTPLHLAARFGHSGVVDFLMSTTEDVEAKLAMFSTEDGDGRTAVQVAVHKPDCQAHIQNIQAEAQKEKDELDAAAKAAALAAKKGKKKGKGGKGKGKGKKK